MPQNIKIRQQVLTLQQKMPGRGLFKNDSRWHTPTTALRMLSPYGYCWHS